METITYGGRRIVEVDIVRMRAERNQQLIVGLIHDWFVEVDVGNTVSLLNHSRALNELKGRQLTYRRIDQLNLCLKLRLQSFIFWPSIIRDESIGTLLKAPDGLLL